MRIGQDDVHDQTASDREMVGCEGATLVQQLLLLAVADSGLRVYVWGAAHCFRTTRIAVTSTGVA